jgi:N-acetylglucosaminyl-diphospho-decaprenol L-rhamnosyltransferase
MMRLSIVILNYNTADLLRECLHSLRSDIEAGEVRVIVVDNCSVDESRSMLDDKFPQVETVFLEKNTGFSTGNNTALKMLDSDYAMLLNPDTEVRPGAIRAIIDFMDNTPRCGVMGPKLLNPDGSRQLSCRSFPSYKTAFFNRYSLFTRLFPENRHSREYLLSSLEANEPMEVDWVSGAALVVRCSAIKQVGLLDEGFFMYAEDVDWCYRFKQSEWEVWFMPDAEIMHHIGGSSRSLPAKTLLERHRSMYYFYRKHYSRGVPILDFMVFFGVVLRVILKLHGLRKGGAT